MWLGPFANSPVRMSRDVYSKAVCSLISSPAMINVVTIQQKINQRTDLISSICIYIK